MTIVVLIAPLHILPLLIITLTSINTIIIIIITYTCTTISNILFSNIYALYANHTFPPFQPGSHQQPI
jgi:hypothetical protein